MQFYDKIVQHTSEHRMNPIRKSIRIVGATTLSRELGLSRSAIYAWVRNNQMPARYVLKIEQLSGVSRHELAPDVFGVAQN